MFKLALIILVAFSPTTHAEDNSAFKRVNFDNFLSVDLPRDWTYMDKSLSSHINTSSEAKARVLGIEINQGDNKVIVAANAYDKAGHSNATLRISVREQATLTQPQMRELMKESPEAIAELFRPVTTETVKAMLKMPGAKQYRLRSIKMLENHSLVCYQTIYEGDFGRGLVISSTSVCPLENKTLKFSSSYQKGLEALYAPIIDWIWASLQLSPKA